MNIIQDMKAYSGGNFVKSVLTLFFDPNFKAVLLYRQASYLHRQFNLQILPRMLRQHSRTFYSIDIDFRAIIGPGFKIVHGVGLVIGFDVTAGKNLVVYQGVTLGGNNGKKRIKGDREITQPYLGNNCMIYTSAVIVGPVLVGDNSIIGACSVITTDVPANSMVYTKNETVYKSLKLQTDDV